MKDRPTPETDAKVYMIDEIEEMVPADVARRLERERDALGAALTRLALRNAIMASLEPVRDDEDADLESARNQAQAALKAIRTSLQ